MNKVERVSSLRAAVSAARKERKTIGFVPTMGNLHEGHLELVRQAKQRAEFVVVSIFVNPTQFGANEDLDNYPATPEEDARSLAELGADLLFLPELTTMYPSALEEQTVVYVPKIGDLYCGKDRPEHFYGVTTVVSRLFNMVQPDIAVFGKKDYQQLTIIRRMVEDLAYPIQVVGVDTIRADDGLALSSRNGYLTAAELRAAPLLAKILNEMAVRMQDKGAIPSKKWLREIESEAKAELLSKGFSPQYITVCRQSDLQPAKRGDTKLVVLAAAQLGKARLIDNLEVELTES
ncbi:pantoate--beta-alanine ligase [Arenicella xantha]|uniref:Pantothenate synthetase n=1 Tax=Arenicella xantha TaxID=644221 RepID=A0A395JJG9_9GAMM|nr:pantoate--beta-alanine ligase [Arenicella xantha]RBP49201.1 pantothenate synthetase [Arenicella xantha]